MTPTPAARDDAELRLAEAELAAGAEEGEAA